MGKQALAQPTSPADATTPSSFARGIGKANKKMRRQCKLGHLATQATPRLPLPPPMKRLVEALKPEACPRITPSTSIVGPTGYVTLSRDEMTTDAGSHDAVWGCDHHNRAFVAFVTAGDDVVTFFQRYKTGQTGLVGDGLWVINGDDKMKREWGGSGRVIELDGSTDPRFEQVVKKNCSAFN